MQLYRGLGSLRSWAARAPRRQMVLRHHLVNQIVWTLFSLLRLCARAGCLLCEHFSLRRLLTLSFKDPEYALRTLLISELRLRKFV